MFSYLVSNLGTVKLWWIQVNRHIPNYQHNLKHLKKKGGLDF